MNYESVVASIEKPDYREKVVKEYQGTRDIIKDLVYCFKKYNYQAKPIAKDYGTGNIKTDSKKIWNFIRKNIKYKAEPEGDQTTRSFSRIINDKWGDCKHSALTVGSIGWNEGYTVIFRIVRYVTYNGSKKEYLHHVYTILEDKNGTQVIVDPLQDFDYEKPFDKKIGDYKAINNMTLTRLTGVNALRAEALTEKNIRHLKHGVRKHKRKHPHGHGNHCNNHLHPQYPHHLHPFAPTHNSLIEAHEIHGIDTIGEREIIMTPMGVGEEGIGELEDMQGIGRRSRAQRKAARAGRKTKRKARQATRRANRKERGGLFRSIALAPVRGAFSALLLLNFKNFAGRFKQALDRGKEADLKAFAKKFGYKYNIFKNQMLKGARKKSLGEISGTEIHQVEGMGFVVTATAIATASAAIAAAVSLLKKLGLGQHDDDSTLKESLDNVSKGADTAATTATALENTANQLTTNTNTGSNSDGGGSTSPSSGGGGGGSDNTDMSVPKDTDVKPGGDIDKPEGDSSFMDKLKSIPTPVIIVGAVGIAYFAGKKFKIW